MLSLVGANGLIVGVSLVQRLVATTDPLAVSLVGFAFLKTAIHVTWIIAWPIYCRSRNWPNLYRGGRWHRLLFIAVASVSVVILVAIAILGRA